MQTVLFTNYSKETFSHAWDGNLYTFTSGQSMFLQDYLAKHLAKHLAVRELNRTGKIPSGIILDQEMQKALSAEPTVAATPVEAEIEVINKNKGKATKKAKEVVEDEFEGAND